MDEAAVCALSYSPWWERCCFNILSADGCCVDMYKPGMAFCELHKNARGVRVASVVYAARIRRAGGHAALRRVCSNLQTTKRHHRRFGFYLQRPAPRNGERPMQPQRRPCSRAEEQRRKRRPFNWEQSERHVAVTERKPASPLCTRELLAEVLGEAHRRSRRDLSFSHFHTSTDTRVFATALSRLDEVHSSV